MANPQHQPQPQQQKQVVSEKPIQPSEMTLDVLLSHIAQSITLNPGYMPKARKDLYFWWMANAPVDDADQRKVLAREVRKKLDIARCAMEGLTSEFLTMASNDF